MLIKAGGLGVGACSNKTCNTNSLSHLVLLARIDYCACDWFPAENLHCIDLL